MPYSFAKPTVLRFAVPGLLAAFVAACLHDDEAAAAREAPPRDHYILYGGEYSSLHGVDAADFTPEPMLTGLVADMLFQQKAGTLEGDVIRDYRPYSLVYLKDGHWYRRSMRTDHDPGAIQVSSETDPPFCFVPPALIETDLADPEAAILIYPRGPEGNCDQMRMVHVTDSPETDPIPIDLNPSALLAGLYYDVDGRLTGVLAIEAEPAFEIALYNADFTQREVLINSWHSVDAMVGSASYTFLEIDDKVYRIDPVAGTAVVKHTLEAGYNAGSVLADESSMYFVEHAPAPARLWRLALDGDSGAELVRESEASLSLVGLTDTHVVFRDGGDLVTLAKSATAAELPTRIGDADLPAWTAGAYVFHNVPEIVSGALQWRAVLRQGDGTLVFDLPRSEWVGHAPHFELKLRNYYDRPSAFGLLARGYSGQYNSTGLQGATLESFDFLGGGTRVMGSVAGSMTIDAHELSGPVGVGRAIVNGQPSFLGLDLERGVVELLGTDP